MADQNKDSELSVATLFDTDFNMSWDQLKTLSLQETLMMDQIIIENEKIIYRDASGVRLPKLH